MELLVVISIIGILAGCCCRPWRRPKYARRKPRRGFKSVTLVTAIQQYDSAYSRFPVSTAAQECGCGSVVISPTAARFCTLYSTSRNSNSSIIYVTNNSEVIAILMDITNYPTALTTVNVNHQKNPQQTFS